MRSIDQCQREKGFTIVEILIAAALLAALALGGMKLFKQQITGQRTIEANYEVASLVQQMRTVLSDTANCASSLQGLNPSSGTPTYLRKEVGAGFETIYAVNSVQPGTIKILSYRLSRSFPDLASNETMLKIQFSRGLSAIKDEITKMIKIVYTTDASGNISTCYAFNNNSDTYWIQSLTQPENIYYMAGNVGIGISTPDKQLTVSQGARIRGVLIGEGNSNVDMAYPYESVGVNSGMNLRLQSPMGIGFHTGMTSSEPDNNSKNRLWISQAGSVGVGTVSPEQRLHVEGGVKSIYGEPTGSNTSAAGFSFDGDTGLFAAGDGVLNLWSNNVKTMSLYGGNVGIGTSAAPVAKLEVNGPIKVGSAPNTCDASIAGQQRYEPTARVMQFCNGTSWVSMGGGGMDFTPLTDGLSWSSVSLTTSGGSGTAASPPISLADAGGYSCGALVTITLSAPGMTSSTKAALVAFASFDSSENSPAARVFTTGNVLVGHVGQVGRGGDGRSYGAGGEMVIPLSGQAFRIQGCKGGGSNADFYYVVKAVLN